MSDHSQQFYADLQNTVTRSARLMVPPMLDWFAPLSVIAVACGGSSCKQITLWHKQHLALLARENVVVVNPMLRAAMNKDYASPLAVVHPEQFVHSMKSAQPSFSRWLKMAPNTRRRAAAKRRRPSP